MKKVIALALALTLALSMASVAFAENFYPGEKTTVADISLDKFTNLTIDATTFDKADYTVTAKWTKGDALVESVKLVSAKTGASNGYVEIAFKENFTITDPKDVIGEITLKERTGSKTSDTLKITLGDITVSNDVDYVFGTKKADDADKIDPVDNNTLYICDEDNAGYVKFSTESNLLGVTLKMAAKEKVFMYTIENDGDIMDALEEKYEDADINTYTFGGAPSFKNAADFTLQGDYSDQYVIYAYEGKKLTKVDAKWNSEDGVYEWSTKTPRTYVISDVELVAADEETEEDDKNPDTGANDVVGVAAALAVVSLVAADAVSLKK